MVDMCKRLQQPCLQWVSCISEKHYGHVDNLILIFKFLGKIWEEIIGFTLVEYFRVSKHSGIMDAPWPSNVYVRDNEPVITGGLENDRVPALSIQVVTMGNSWSNDWNMGPINGPCTVWKPPNLLK